MRLILRPGQLRPPALPHFRQTAQQQLRPALEQQREQFRCLHVGVKGDLQQRGGTCMRIGFKGVACTSREPGRGDAYMPVSSFLSASTGPYPPWLPHLSPCDPPSPCLSPSPVPPLAPRRTAGPCMLRSRPRAQCSGFKSVTTVGYPTPLGKQVATPAKQAFAWAAYREVEFSRCKCMEPDAARCIRGLLPPSGL